MKRRSIKIDESNACRRAESIIKREFAVSDTYLRRLKGIPFGITANGAHIRSTDILNVGDELSIIVSDAQEDRPAGRILPMNILYEDEWLLVINKAAGMAVHSSTREPDMETVEDGLYAYLKADERPHPVSRLDRGTTGAMVVAKSGYMHALLKKGMESGDFCKKYIAITAAVPNPKRGKADLPIGFEENSRYKRGIAQNGSPALSLYEVIAESRGMALVLLEPKTGRTHQLRVHMAALGCPLVGDWLYGKESGDIARPALHALEVGFTHPISGARLHINAPIPNDMVKIMEQLSLCSPKSGGIV